MPGGWTMSMAWMRMPGQTWPGAAASFLGMWVVMMVAMMLPSLVPMLWRYRQAVGRTGETRLGRLTVLVGEGYFFVWTVFGMAAFPLGVALAAVEMQVAGAGARRAGRGRRGRPDRRRAPVHRRGRRVTSPAAGRRRGTARALSADAGTAWRYGLRLGLHCGLLLCRPDWRSFWLSASWTCARWSSWRQPSPPNVSHRPVERIARAIGVVAVGAGLLLIAQAVCLA